MSVANPFYDNNGIFNSNNDVYILCLQNGVEKFDNIFLNSPAITKEHINYLVKNVILVKGCKQMVGNHKDILFTIDSNFLKHFIANEMFQLENGVENVLLMTSISYSDVILYMKLYDTLDINEYIRLHMLTDYFKINNDTRIFNFLFCFLDDNNDSKLDEQQVVELLNHFDDKHKYYFICYLVKTKKYSQLVIKILDMIIPVVRKHKEIFRYLWGYLWMNLFSSKYVFDIDTASKLPFFKYYKNDPYYNPYLSILDLQDNLPYEKCMQGIKLIKNYEYKIATLGEFKENLRICTNGLFDKMDWTNIAFCGLSEFVIQNHPLMIECGGDIYKYYKKYCNFKPLLVCNVPTIHEFLDKTNDIVDSIECNSDEQVEVKIDLDRYITITVSEEEKVKNIDSMETKEYYYQHYVQYKIAKNKTIDRSKSLVHKQYCKLISPEELIIKIGSIKRKNDNEHIVNDSIKITEDIKCTLITQKGYPDITLKHIFSDFMSHVSSSNVMPCDRSYYDGHNAYMVPEAITAYMTLMNIAPPNDVSSTYSYGDDAEILFRKFGYGCYTLSHNNNNCGDVKLGKQVMQYVSDKENSVFSNILRVKNEKGVYMPVKKWAIDAGYDIV